MTASLGVRDFSAYCSTVEVHAKEGVVLHRIEIERSPNLVGEVRKRFFSFDSNGRLVLQVDPAELRAPVVGSTVIWEKVQK